MSEKDAELARLREIVALAEKMREGQRAYFKDRDRDRLEKSKRLERALDRALAELKTPVLF